MIIVCRMRGRYAAHARTGPLLDFFDIQTTRRHLSCTSRKAHAPLIDAHLYRTNRMLVPSYVVGRFEVGSADFADKRRAIFVLDCRQYER